MPKKLRKRIAVLLVALLASTQLSAAMARCAMDPDMPMIAMAAVPDHPCEGCETPLDKPRDSVCAAHCAAAEQPAAASIALFTPPILRVALPLAPRFPDARPTGLAAPPAGAPPRRILLHSFLI